MKPETFDHLAAKAACGNEAARVFLHQITETAHFWDDLIDRDKPLDDATINGAMWKAIITLPANPFYRAHFDTLAPVIMSAAVNWLGANEIENHGAPGVASFAMRSAYCDLVGIVALICGGVDHAKHIAALARDMCHSEGIDGYLASLAEEQRARSENHGSL